MITHEYIKDVLLALDMKVSEDYFTKEFDILLDYITQQEKVSKLLELYRKAHIDVLNGELAEEIQALEEELK